MLKRLICLILAMLKRIVCLLLGHKGCQFVEAFPPEQRLNTLCIEFRTLPRGAPQQKWEGRICRRCGTMYAAPMPAYVRGGLPGWPAKDPGADAEAGQALTPVCEWEKQEAAAETKA